MAIHARPGRMNLPTIDSDPSSPGWKRVKGEPMTTFTQSLGHDPNGSYVQPICSCGWQGVARSTRRSIEVYDLAERDAQQHGYAHEHGLGWFDYQKGWQQP